MSWLSLLLTWTWCDIVRPADQPCSEMIRQALETSVCIGAKQTIQRTEANWNLTLYFCSEVVLCSIRKMGLADFSPFNFSVWAPRVCGMISMRACYITGAVPCSVLSQVAPVVTWSHPVTKPRDQTLKLNVLSLQSGHTHRRCKV